MDSFTQDLRIRQLRELANERVGAKAAEDAAIARRRDIDKKIADLLPSPNGVTGTGSAEVYLPDGRLAKVKVRHSLNYRVDDDDAARLLFKHPQLTDLFRAKYEVSVAALPGFLASPEFGTEIANAITTKPASPSVSIDIE